MAREWIDGLIGKRKAEHDRKEVLKRFSGIAASMAPHKFRELCKVLEDDISYWRRETNDSTMTVRLESDGLCLRIERPERPALSLTLKLDTNAPILTWQGLVDGELVNMVIHVVCKGPTDCYYHLDSIETGYASAEPISRLLLEGILAKCRISTL